MVILHPADQFCKNCYFYVNGTKVPGICAFLAPDPSGSFPSILPTDWCGEWREGPPPSEEFQYDRVETDANSLAVFVFPIAYALAPNVVFSIGTGINPPYAGNLMSVTTTQATVQVWRDNNQPAGAGIGVTMLAMPVEV